MRLIPDLLSLVAAFPVERRSDTNSGRLHRRLSSHCRFLANCSPWVGKSKVMVSDNRRIRQQFTYARDAVTDHPATMSREWLLGFWRCLDYLRLRRLQMLSEKSKRIRIDLCDSPLLSMHTEACM